MRSCKEWISCLWISGWRFWLSLGANDWTRERKRFKLSEWNGSGGLFFGAFISHHTYRTATKSSEHINNQWYLFFLWIQVPRSFIPTFFIVLRSFVPPKTKRHLSKGNLILFLFFPPPNKANCRITRYRRSSFFRTGKSRRMKLGSRTPPPIFFLSKRKAAKKEKTNPWDITNAGLQG